MIEILSAQGEVLLTVPILRDAVSHEELMAQDFVRLSWSSDKGDVIPAGAYIRYNGENYSLLEPYTPEMVSEVEFRYRPEFHSRVDAWDKHPACVYSYGEESNVESKEFDWTFVGSPADAMYIVAQSILEETGEEWSVEISDSLPATIELTCQANSIKSILSAIAERCETDWWVDKSTNTLYLSNCSRGTAIPLAVGKEVGVPSISAPNDGYYTRYYAFGSTRNISQDSNDGSYIANKRLTLDPAVYPNGYKDVKGHFESGVFVSDLHPSEVFSKVLIFDDIYPSSPLIISDVRARLKYRVKDGGEKIVIGGTKEEPIYDQYAIWYFKIDGFSFNKDSIIKDQTLSVHFNDGRLAGHDFKLAYHDEEETVFKEGDVAKFKIEKGDYEILFVQEGDMIIPDLAYIVPSNGDSITLYNIEMPSEYTASAMADLEAAVDKKIAEDSEDQNTYEFNSNPVAFHEQEIDLLLGQNVALISGDEATEGMVATESRVTMIEKHLDFSFEQKIRIGRKVAKSTTTQLKEGLTSVNYNLNVIETFNKLSESIYESHVRTQAQINEALLKLSDMFYWYDEAKTIIATDHALISKQDLSSGAKTQGGGGTGGNTIIIENWYDYDPSLSQALGAGLGFELDKRLSEIEDIDFSVYATQESVTQVAGGLSALEEKVTNLEDKVTKLEDKVGELGGDSDDMFTWLDEDEHTTIFTDKNLVVSGDISDGGTGEAIVGVTSILVNGEYYPDLDGDGVIDLSNAFNNIDVDLDNYYTKEEVDDKFDNINIGDADLSNYYTKDETYSREEIDGLIPESSDMFSWLDEEHTTIITDKNLIVEGDISDGGVGEAVVGVTGILIGEEVYYGEDGIVNLSAALGNIDVDLSDYYTIAEIDGLLTAYQPSETAINVDNIGAQSVAFASLSDKANKAYSFVNENDEEVIYIDGDSIFHVGDIIPEYNYNYYIGTDERYYKCVSSNAVFAGSARNNLWLLAGSYDGMKIIFGSADSCETPLGDRTRFAELGDDGLQVNVDLILGDTVISGYDNVVTIEGSLIVEGDVASTDSSEGGSAIIPDLSDYATIDYVDSNFLPATYDSYHNWYEIDGISTFSDEVYVNSELYIDYERVLYIGDAGIAGVNDADLEISAGHILFYVDYFEAQSFEFHVNGERVFNIGSGFTCEGDGFITGALEVDGEISSPTIVDIWRRLSALEDK